MELAGFERLRYFAPTAMCVYLAVICLALLVTSLFLGKLKIAPAVTASGIYGLMVSGGLALAFWSAQRRDLRFEHIATETGEAVNFAAARAAALGAGWSIRHEVAPRLIEAQTAGGILAVGERVVVQCRGYEVLVASICDPTVGFTLSGRRSCRAHRAMIRRVVLNERSNPEC